MLFQLRYCALPDDAISILHMQPTSSWKRELTEAYFHQQKHAHSQMALLTSLQSFC